MAQRDSPPWRPIARAAAASADRTGDSRSSAGNQPGERERRAIELVFPSAFSLLDK